MELLKMGMYVTYPFGEYHGPPIQSASPTKSHELIAQKVGVLLHHLPKM